jgi:hypothetical protein
LHDAIAEKQRQDQHHCSSVDVYIAPPRLAARSLGSQSSFVYLQLGLVGFSLSLADRFCRIVQILNGLAASGNHKGSPTAGADSATAFVFRLSTDLFAALADKLDHHRSGLVNAHPQVNFIPAYRMDTSRDTMS